MSGKRDLGEDSSQTLAAEIAWYGVSRALPAALSFATVWLLVRALGRAEYGWFAILYAAGNAVSTISCGWLTQGLLRFVPGLGVERLDLRRSLGPAFGLALAFGLLLMLPALLLTGELNAGVAAVAAIMVSAFTAHAVTAAMLQATLLPRRVAEIEIVRSSSALAFTGVACSWMGLGFLGAASAFAISMIASACWGARTILREHAGGASAGRPVAPPLSLRTLLRFGAPMSFWFALWLAFPLVDRAVIERLLGIEQTGLYAAIHDLGFRGCGFLLMPVVLALHPRIMSSLHVAKQPAAKRLLSIGIAVEVVIGGLIVGAIAISAPILLELYFGDQATGNSSSTLVILSASGCVWSIALLAHKPLEIDQRTTAMLLLMAAALVIATVGTLYGVPHHGLQAAAVANLVAGSFYALSSYIVGVWPRSRIVAPHTSRVGP